MIDNHQKIIFILSSTELGGAENQAILLANEFIKKNTFLVNFILYKSEIETGAVPNKLSKLNIPYYIIKWPSSRYLVLKYFRLLKYIFLLKKLHPAILMPYTTYPNIFTSFIWKYTGAQLCIWNQRDEGIALSTNWFTRKAISNSTGFIANSITAKDFLINKFNIPIEKISLIHNGMIELEVLVERDEWRRKLSFDSNDILICMIANISKYKDHETLLRAFKLLQTKYTEKPLKLLLVGRFDTNYEYLLNLSKELNISEDIYFLGKLDDIGSLLNAIDISVLSSKSEGLPNVVIESMYSGVPVIGSRIDGIIEVLGDNYREYLATPGDFNELSEIFLFFLNNPATTVKLIKTNKNRVASKFSLNNLYEATLKTIDKCKTS